MRKIICDKCGKEQKGEVKVRSIKVEITQPVGALNYAYANSLSAANKKDDTSIDLCDDCFTVLKDELTAKIAEFLKK